MKKIFTIALFAALLFGAVAHAEVSCAKAGQENLQALMACINSHSTSSNGPQSVNMANHLAARVNIRPHAYPVVPVSNLVTDMFIGGRYSYARYIPLAYPYGFYNRY